MGDRKQGEGLMPLSTYETAGGVEVQRGTRPLSYETAISYAVEKLNAHRVAVFSSNYEYPGRYTRWDTAIVDPPIEIEGRGRQLTVKPLNSRCAPMLTMLHNAVKDEAYI